MNILVDVDFGALLKVYPGKVFVDVAEEAVGALASLPVQGIRCVAAHHVSPHDWHRLIEKARAVAPRLLWVADTLGASGDAMAATLAAGFDWFFSSVKWWDGKAPWALDQYERFRTVSHSIGFPEEPDGARLCDELYRHDIRDPAEIAAHYRLRYALAAFFGAGVAMPAGYEIASSGNGRREAAGDVDISASVTAINRIKATHPGLAVERPQRLLPVEDVLALAKIDEDCRIASCFIANFGARGRNVDLAKIGGSLNIGAANLHDAMPGSLPRTTHRPIWLAPYDWCLLVASPVPAGAMARLAPRQAPRSKAKAPGRAPAIVIEKVTPEIDGGFFPIKRAVGDDLAVSADIFSAGHEVVGAALLYRHDGERLWSLTPMRHVDNDRWIGSAPLLRNRRYFYNIEAWIDVFASWHRDVAAKYDAGQDVAPDLAEGRHLLAQAAARVRGPARKSQQ